MDKDQIDISDETMQNNPKTTAKKSSHAGLWVTICSILLVGLLALGGWAYYNQKMEYESSIAESEAAISELQAKLDTLQADKTVTVDGGDKQVSLTQPADWTVVKASHETGLIDNNTTVEDATLTSKSGKTVVRVQTGISGIGGACVAEDQPDSTLDSYEVSKMPKSNDYVFIQYYSKNGQAYGAHVATAESVNGVKQGDNVCDVAFTEFMNVEGGQGAFMIKINSSELENLQSKNDLPSAAQMKLFFESDEYKEAKAIVLSAKIADK